MKIIAPHRHIKAGLRRQRGYISPAVLSAIGGRRRSGTTGGGGGGEGEPTDPDFASVVSLLHFDDVSSPQQPPRDFAPGSPSRVWTLNGNAQQASDQSKFGGASLRCDGTGDFISAPDSADWNFANGDFTVECWARFATVAAAGFVTQWTTVGNQRAWALEYTGTHLRFLYTTDGTSGTSNGFNTPWAASANTWYHIAACRSGVDLYVFVNGSQIGSDFNISTSTIFNSTGDVQIGAFNSGESINGWIDEVRITKGVARYFGSPSSFTPPTSAFPNS